MIRWGTSSWSEKSWVGPFYPPGTKPGDFLRYYATQFDTVEVDPRGRALDYRGSYYRRLDFAWNWQGLKTKGVTIPGGYEVEGQIPLASFQAMGFPQLRPGVKIRGGLYRAEFSHDRSGRPVEQRESIHNLGRQLDGPPPIEAWMSWVDPKTEGGTPMCHMLYHAHQILGEWIGSHPRSFPPIVVHITDGESQDGDPNPYAEAVTGLTTDQDHHCREEKSNHDHPHQSQQQRKRK